MPRNFKLRRFAAGMLCLLFAGCASNVTAPEWGTLKSSVETLYLNYWDLKRLHRDLHNVALVHLEASGEQLGEIQSAARFIQQANLIAFYQWELLSITEYVRNSARYDFFTLRQRSLNNARDKSKDLVLSTRVYQAFIRDPQAIELIEACITRIEKHRSLYLQMTKELERLKNDLRPSTTPADKSLTPLPLSYKSGSNKVPSDT